MLLIHVYLYTATLVQPRNPSYIFIPSNTYIITNTKWSEALLRVSTTFLFVHIFTSTHNFQNCNWMEYLMCYRACLCALVWRQVGGGWWTWRSTHLWHYRLHYETPTEILLYAAKPDTARCAISMVRWCAEWTRDALSYTETVCEWNYTVGIRSAMNGSWQGVWRHEF